MIWGRQVAGLPGCRVAESNLIELQLNLGCMIWGRQVAGSHMKDTVVCLASPQVAGLLGRRVKPYSASAKVA